MMKSKRRKISNAVMCVGMLLVAAAVLLAAYNIYDETRAARSVKNILESLIPEIPDYNSYPVFDEEKKNWDSDMNDEENKPLYVLNPELEMPTVAVNTIEYIGILAIPSLNLELPVIGEWNYYDLRFAPCCYSGSAYNGNFVICAHNYAEHFGNVQDLAEGDEVFFTDVEGNVFCYNVSFLDVLQPTDVEEMTSDGFDLTLFTCNFTGQSRVAVRCSKR